MAITTDTGRLLEAAENLTGLRRDLLCVAGLTHDAASHVPDMDGTHFSGMFDVLVDGLAAALNSGDASRIEEAARNLVAGVPGGPAALLAAAGGDDRAAEFVGALLLLRRRITDLDRAVTAAHASLRSHQCSGECAGLVAGTALGQEDSVGDPAVGSVAR